MKIGETWFYGLPIHEKKKKTETEKSRATVLLTEVQYIILIKIERLRKFT